MMKLYLCPSDSSGEATGKITTGALTGSRPSTTTVTLALGNYVVNPLALPVGSALERSFTDGTTNTLLFTERYRTCQGVSVAWGYNFYGKADKQGPTFDTGVAFQIKPPAASCVSGAPQSAHIGSMPVALADGSVRTLSDGHNSATSSAGASVFQALLTPQGGETFNLE